jgi:hypothetical protein
MGLKFNDIDLKLNYNFVVTEVQGRGSAPVSRTVLDHPLVHGDIELNAKLRSRDIVIRGYVYGSDVTTKKDSLIKLVTQAYEKECKLTFPDTNRSIYVKLAGEPIVVGPIGPSLNAQAYELTFQFVAQDPFFYDEEDIALAGFRLVRVDAYAPNYLISPKRALLKREKQVIIEPYTVVNLLGKYGNFETDSNGDGVPDGVWKNYSTDSSYTISRTTDKYFGSYACKVEQTTTSAYRGIRMAIGSGLNDKILFYSAWFKTTAGSGTFSISISVGSWISTTTSGFSSSWKRLYNTYQVPSDETGTLYFETGCTYLNSVPTYVVDGAMVVNLSVMGKLPRALSEFFNNTATYWTDLATTSNITAIDGRTQSGRAWLAELIPYVDSVASFGFVWQ